MASGRRHIAFYSPGLNLLPSAGAAAGVTTRLSVGPNGAQADGRSFVPTLSADGRYAAFYSDATNFVAGDSNNVNDAFVRDRQTNTTSRISVGLAGASPNGGSDTPSISGDGLLVAFTSAATNLIDGDTNNQRDAFGNGRLVVFESDATKLVAGDSNQFTDIFVHDCLR